MIEQYLIHIAILISIFAVLSLALNFSVGFGGMLNLGHVALFAIGAYTSTILTQNGVPFEISFFAAGLLAALFGFALGGATNKLKGEYLALAALGFHFVVMSILLNWSSLTRGPLGISRIPDPKIFGWVVSNNFEYLALSLIFAAISILIIYRITSSAFGRLLQATRDDEISVRVLGKNTFAVKTKAIAISAFFTGLAGSIFAHYISFIDPFSFSLAELIVILIIVILGGLASTKGTVMATFILILLPEALRFAPMPSSMIGPLRQAIYAIILLGILLYKPRGLFGKVDLQ